MLLIYLALFQTYKNSSKRLIEIKPWYHLKRKRNKAKIKAMREYANQFNWKFSVWTEKELGINGS